MTDAVEVVLPETVIFQAIACLILLMVPSIGVVIGMCLIRTLKNEPDVGWMVFGLSSFVTMLGASAWIGTWGDKLWGLAFR